MARPPQYDRDHYEDDPPVNLGTVKASAKRLDDRSRATLLAWLLLYYQDDGKMFSPQINRRRARITLNEVEYWLVRVPKRK